MVGAYSTVLAAPGADVEMVSSAQRDVAARLERLPMRGLRVRARIIVGTATFFDGFDSLSIAQAMPVLAGLWKLQSSEVGFIISAGFFGQLIGALILPGLSERVGRLRVLTWTIALFSLASLACAFAWAPMALAGARFIQGLGLGGEVATAATYINEIASSGRRGRFFLFYEMLFPIGLLCAGIVGAWVVPLFGWQWIFLIGALPGLITVLLRRMLPESPRWLAAKGRFAEADTIVSALEREAEAKSGRPLPAPDLAAVPLPEGGRTNWRELFSPFYRKRTLVIWSVWFCNFFATQGVIAWLPTVYRTVLHTDLATALRYGYIVSVGTVLANLIGALLIDKIGRLWFLRVSLPLGALPLLVLSFVGLTSAKELLAAAFLSYIFTGSVSIVLYLYTPELYPTRMRALACGVGATWRNFATTLSPMLIGLVLARFGINSVFLMLGAVPLIAMVIVLAFGTETRGRVLEEVSP